MEMTVIVVSLKVDLKLKSLELEWSEKTFKENENNKSNEDDLNETRKHKYKKLCKKTEYNFKLIASFLC